MNGDGKKKGSVLVQLDAAQEGPGGTCRELLPSRRAKQVSQPRSVGQNGLPCWGMMGQLFFSSFLVSAAMRKFDER